MAEPPFPSYPPIPGRASRYKALNDGSSSSTLSISPTSSISTEFSSGSSNNNSFLTSSRPMDPPRKPMAPFRGTVRKLRPKVHRENYSTCPQPPQQRAEITPAHPPQNVISDTVPSQNESTLHEMPIDAEEPLLGGSTISGSGSQSIQPLAEEVEFPVLQENRPLRLGNAWKTQIELKLKLSKLPENIATVDLWSLFSKFGTVEELDISENREGKATGYGHVIFRPPPSTKFWSQNLSIRLQADGTSHWIQADPKPSNREFAVPSPVRPNVKYPEYIKIPVKRLDFGFMVHEKTMMSMFSTESTPNIQPSLCTEISFEVDLHRKNLRLRFDIVYNTSDGKPKKRRERYRIQIPFLGLEELFDTLCDRTDERLRSILIPLKTPPQIWRRIHRVENSHDKVRHRRWNEWDAWYRQTDILENMADIKNEPLAIRKKKPVIDIGRWTTYRFSFELDEAQNDDFDLMLMALKDFNISFTKFPDFGFREDQNLPVWDVIDPPKSVPSYLGQLMSEYNRTPLRYPLRYQLEACISQGCISEYNMTKEFVEKLVKMENRDEGSAVKLLEAVVDQDKRFYEPMDIFNHFKGQRLPKSRHIPEYCIETRKATITPTMIYYTNPTVETSNRVVRHYFAYRDRFLRVQFTDEKRHGKVSATEEKNSHELFTRVKRAMLNGIIIGDRHFKFLAFGNSQLRQHGAYFFAETTDVTCDDIRKWMGDFSNIKIIAKYAARLGQCFSTTRAINGFRVKTTDIPDVERNGYCFTDGCGSISQSAAQLIAAELKLLKDEAPPSCFQFRLGGCKGILAVDLNLKKGETKEASFQVCIRPSQRKFEANHNILEIIKASAFSSAFLNRQLIAVLSDLGLDEQILLDKLDDQLRALNAAVESDKAALSLLRKFIDPNQATLRIARLILDGFMASKEPFLECLLHLWRAWSIKMLKEKARIAVENGCFLFGVVDETATLRGHFEEEHRKMREDRAEGGLLKTRLLPEIFVQIPDPENKGTYRIIKGPCLLARNPSLHPGDLRIVNAVDCPKLRHLRNVVVLPQTGDRPIANMCSGGDLDGDDFIVIWDGAFLPPRINEMPADYTPPKPKEATDGKVTIDHISTFFVNYMKNDMLGAIANAHLATADDDPNGIELAGLHSLAVDFPKTGVEAKMGRHLRIKKWPHFFEKKQDNPSKIYHSVNILGQLYDAVDRVSFRPGEVAKELQFDDRILKAFEDIDERMLNTARDLKARYDDAMRRIMGQHEIKTEFEVWSTFVLDHLQFGSDYKFHEDIGEICSALLDRFEREARAEVRTDDEYSIGRFAAAMYTVTNEEYTQTAAEGKTMAMISFPWIFARLLGKIAGGEGVFSRNPETGMCLIPNAETATQLPYLLENKHVPKLEKEMRKEREKKKRGGVVVVMDEDGDGGGGEEKDREDGEEGEEGGRDAFRQGLPPIIEWAEGITLEHLLEASNLAKKAEELDTEAIEMDDDDDDDDNY
ncbi:hypothetical protein H072_8901 [Dactylellina haptotyla CBS 200.50]|uniref:RNA-dependent RNA polymerase n=1 Tax=Dactylellina haptotyla (strain CBS 200.50) TaxID=1284197 RepID=S8BDV6_DACHA|nr:hypothetical protein H072_8901 [Dactylellina haptotyla CBS 200.50]